MAIRWQLHSTTRFGVPVRVDIEDANYSGGIIPICGAGDPVTYTVGQPGTDPLEKIMPSSITLRVIGQEGDFADLFQRDLSRFRIHMYIDGVLESSFIPVQDTFSEPATAGTHVIVINGANLAVYRNRRVSGALDDGVYTRLDAIRRLLGDLFNLPLVDGCVFYPQGSNRNQSALNQIYVKRKRIEEMQIYDALEALIPRGHQIRIARGKVFIVPVTEPTFTGYEFSPSGSYTGSVLYNGNLQGFYTGGALGRIRSKLQSYDGVRRVYQPGDIENIVPSGDIEFDDFVSYPDGGQNGMIPDGWEIVNGVTVSSRRVEIPNGFGWRVGFAPRAQSNQNPDFRTETDFPITAGEVMRHSFTAQYERNRSDSATAVTLWVQVKVGNYYLVRLGSSVYDDDWNTLVWRTAGNLPNPALTQPTMINFSLQAGGFQTFEFVSEPIPTQGNIEYSFNMRPAATSGILSEQNFVIVSSIEGNVVDSDGQLIREVETETGDEDGDLYEYIEQYGDGPVVIAPGALSPVNDFTVPVPGWVYKNESAQPLDELEAKYIHDQVTRSADLITGTVDAFDSIDLVDGMRVNYLQVSMRGGSAEVELYEIQDHDLDAVPRRFEDTQTGRPGGAGEWNWNRWVERLLSIGELAEDIDREERTTILCELDNPIRRGLTYWVINSDEMSETDRWAGIYPFVPVMTDSSGNVVPEPEEGEDIPEGTITRYGPGVINVPIESGFFSAPAGSMIVKAPGQDETESGETDEDIEDIFIDVEEIDKRVADGEANLETLDKKLEDLEEELDWLNDVALPELQAELDELNDVTLPALQNELDALEDDLDELNNVTLPNLQDELDDVLPITEAKITDNAISSPKLQANSVIAGKIATNAVTANTIAANAVTANKIQAGAVVAGKLAADSVAANNIQTDAVTANKIRAGAVIAGKIGADAVTANNIDVDDLTGNTAWIGALTAGIIDTGDLYSRNATIRGHLTVGTSSVAGQISVVGAGTIVVDSNGRIRLNSNGSLEVGNNGNVRINSGGTISIGSGGTISIGSGGTISIGSGSTFTIGSGSTFTMGTEAQMNIGNRIFIGQNLSSFEADNRVFIGNWSNSESAGNIRPIVQVRQNDDNYVLMFARPYGSGDPFFTVRADGQDVLTAGTGGVNIAGTLEISNNGEITNQGGDFVIGAGGVRIQSSQVSPEAPRELRFSTGSTQLAGISVLTGVSPNRMLIRGTGSTAVYIQGAQGINLDRGNGHLVFQGLPTSNPGGSGRVWRDGSTLRIT